MRDLKNGATLRARLLVINNAALEQCKEGRDLRKLADRTDMRLLSCTMIEGRPEYLRRWWAAYLLGSAYERPVNSTRLFEAFRVVLIAELQRPE